MANTWGFFLADMSFMIINGFLDMGNFIHHTLGLITYAHSFYIQRDSTYLAAMILPAEISNIQMNMREVYRKIGMRYTKTYFHNEF